MIPLDLTIKIKTLPESAGVYKFFNKKNTIIYIGKAKNLKKRVNSYFNKNHHNFKTNLLVKQIFSVDIIIVESEMDALLLENNLIKKFKPKYNVLLKDDKTYPWICLKKTPKPSIFYTRKIFNDGSEYFGPFTNVKNVKFLIQLIKEVHPFLNHELIHLLKDSNTAYSNDEIKKSYSSIKSMIKGNFKFSIEKFKSEMLSHSKNLEFEKAQKAKEKLDILINHQVKSTIVNPKITNVDVFSIISDIEFGYVNFMQISYGAIISSYTTEVKKKLNESNSEILEIALNELRKRFKSESKEIILPFKINLFESCKTTVPIVGDKKKLLDLSLKNAKSFRIQKIKQIQIIDPDRHSKRILKQMKIDLNMNVIPFNIECFDNSNIQGSSPTSACVVFKNAKPSKKDYRHFNIKSVKGPNDYASMEEIILRRYSRLIKEKITLPDLIIIDGGKGQLSSALKSLKKLKLEKKIYIIGIAKKLEEIFFPNDSIPLYLDKTSETLKLIQQLRNEAHRFSLKLHRNKRLKKTITSSLDSIPGIGPKTVELLIKKYKSIKKISEISLESLSDDIGLSKASILIENLKNFSKN